MVSDSLLLFRVQNQIDGVMVVNCLPKKQHHMKGLSPSLLLSTLEIAQEQLWNVPQEREKEGGPPAPERDYVTLCVGRAQQTWAVFRTPVS